jgi:TolB-like protein/DNA-binding winged helix-turn-helix (wHTH) protein/Tfp pilus assembly protein PilF
MSEPDGHVVYEFGDFRLDATRRLLFAKGATEPLTLTPRVFDTILYFVEHRGELLDKTRLLADLWPGVVVEENNLTQVISVLRHVLGETRGENRYLATAPGRGYRFVADVIRVPDAAPVAELTAPSDRTVKPNVDQPRRARLVALVALAACVAGAVIFTYRWSAQSRGPFSAEASALPPRNVAVLAFENLSSEAGDEFVTFGIAESVRHRLAEVRDLSVIAQTSSFAVRGQHTDARDIGRKLNARYLVEGSVQRADDRLRVTAQLIDAATGVHVWSLRFDRTIDDIFAVEDEIAHGVARALEVSLSDPQHPFAGYGTDAYLAFLQGQAFIGSRKIGDATLAIERFSHAVELAPKFAAAYAALADAHRHLAYLHEDRPDATRIMADAVNRAEPFLNKALQLDSALGEAYITRADIKAFRGDVSGAEADYRQGLALSPNYGVGHEHFADFLWTTARRNDEALAELDAARRIDPFTPRNHYYKGLMLLFGEVAGSSEEAERLFLQSLQVDPDFHPALLRLAQIRWLDGRFAEAVRLGERAVAIDPNAEWLRWFLVDFYLELGDVDAARSVLAEQPQPAHPSQWLTICTYERKPDRAADLVRTYADRDSGWFSDQDIVAYALRDAAQATGEFARARRELLTLRIRYADAPMENPFRLATLAQVTDTLGDRREAERYARQLLDGGRLKDSYNFAQKAVALTVLGQRDAAIELLEQSFARGFRKRWWYVFSREPAFEPMREDPRFQSLAARAHAHSVAQRKLLEQMRKRGEAPMRTGSASSSDGAC